MPTAKPNALALAKQSLATSLAQDHSYDHTMSADGKIEAMVLMHSRMGIRIEHNLNKSRLNLWISPQAGTSLDYHDRNFSSRDDNTSIFDRIAFPELKAKGFVKCDYDPFHCVLHFNGQKLHLATLLDKPVVLLWAESEEVVDFKSDKQDTILSRTPSVFAVRHPDRGKVLDFVAALGKGKSSFWHQPEVDTGRSTYARVVLAPNQLLVIGGELKKEDVLSVTKRAAAQPIARLLAGNEKKIAAALRPATYTFRNVDPDLQKLFDINKRHLLSVQDASGAMRAALKYVYYLIWTTDGSVTATSMMQAGWREFMERWVKFVLANPAQQERPPRGLSYGQLVNKITKREEFGLLCAVWPAFMHWGLTGDKRFVTGKALAVMEAAFDWLERYCWDDKVKALGTFYHGGGSEDPFYGSNDFGWDAAVGSPMSRGLYAPRHEGHPILRTYEFGMNLNMYNMALMLASACTGASAAAYRRKAAAYGTFLEKLMDIGARAYYLLDGKGLTPVNDRHGTLATGLLAVQSRSPAFYMPRFRTQFMNRMRAFTPDSEDTVKGKMPCYYYGLLAGLDTEFVDEEGVLKSIEASLQYHVRPSRFIPMPYTMVEVMGAKDGEYHDIRPQAFSAGPFEAAAANLALRTMPFGVSVRGANHVARVRGYDYRGGTLDIDYRGTGKIRRVAVNGRELRNCLQLPDRWIRTGRNAIRVELGTPPAATPTLVYSTVQLRDVICTAHSVTYAVTAHCQNVLIIRDAVGTVSVTDAKGRAVKASQENEGRYLFIELEGQGPFRVTVRNR